MLRALTYFESIFNGIIKIILDVGIGYDLCGLDCQKGKIYRHLRCLSHALDPLGFGVWHLPKVKSANERSPRTLYNKYNDYWSQKNGGLNK